MMICADAKRNGGIVSFSYQLTRIARVRAWTRGSPSATNKDRGKGTQQLGRGHYGVVCVGGGKNRGQPVAR